MPLFVIDIDAEPILVFPEDDLALAKEEAATGNIIDALREFRRDGQPVWDGETPLSVREADADEGALWHAGLAEALEDGEIDEDEQDEFAVFLVETETETDSDG